MAALTLFTLIFLSSVAHAEFTIKWFPEAETPQQSPDRGNLMQQIRSPKNITVSCMSLRGVESGVRRMVNEMQLINNDSATWHNKKGCSVLGAKHVFVTERKKACAARVPRCNQVGMVGWIATDQWLVPVERIAYTGELLGSDERRHPRLAWRPSAVYSRARYKLPRTCWSRSESIDGVKIIGHQFSAGNPADDWGKAFCKQPTLKRR